MFDFSHTPTLPYIKRAIIYMTLMARLTLWHGMLIAENKVIGVCRRARMIDHLLHFCEWGGILFLIIIGAFAPIIIKRFLTLTI